MRAFLAIGVALVGLALVTSAAASTPHAKARTLLLSCRGAMAHVAVGPVAANTPLVPKMNRAVSAAFQKCTAIGGPLLNLASAHPKDAALEDAYQAYSEFGIGIGDYLTYLHNVAFGRTGVGMLHQAEREIAQGRAMIKRVLPKLK